MTDLWNKLSAVMDANGQPQFQLVGTSYDSSLVWGKHVWEDELLYWRMIPKERLSKKVLLLAAEDVLPNCFSFVLYSTEDDDFYITCPITNSEHADIKHYMPAQCKPIGIVNISNNMFNDKDVLNMVADVYVPFVRIASDIYDNAPGVIPYMWTCVSIDSIDDATGDDADHVNSIRAIKEIPGRIYGCEESAADHYISLNSIIRDYLMDIIGSGYYTDFSDGKSVYRIHHQAPFERHVPAEAFTPVVLKNYARFTKINKYESNYFSELGKKQVPLVDTTNDEEMYMKCISRQQVGGMNAMMAIAADGAESTKEPKRSFEDIVNINKDVLEQMDCVSNLKLTNDKKVAWGLVDGMFTYWRVIPKECMFTNLFGQAFPDPETRCFRFAMYSNDVHYLIMVIPEAGKYSAYQYKPEGYDLVGLIEMDDEAIALRDRIELLMDVLVPFVMINGEYQPIVWSRLDKHNLLNGIKRSTNAAEVAVYADGIAYDLLDDNNMLSADKVRNFVYDIMELVIQDQVSSVGYDRDQIVHFMNSKFMYSFCSPLLVEDMRQPVYVNMLAILFGVLLETVEGAIDGSYFSQLGSSSLVTLIEMMW